MATIPASADFQKSHPLALPPSLNLSPDFLDLVSDLSSLLKRVRAGLDTPSTLLITEQLPPAEGAVHTSSTAAAVAANGPIKIKDVSAAADLLKHRLQNARDTLKKLPDIDRSVLQQEEEMASLKERMMKQMAMIATIRNSGADSQQSVALLAHEC